MWYLFELLNIAVLEESPAPDYTAVFDFGTYGQKEIRFLKSTAGYIVIFDGVVFRPGLNGRNPLIKDNRAVMITESGKIFAGYYDN